MIFMEIRNVVNKVENEYPKMEQISKKHLSNSVPRKWLKVGLSSLVIAILTKNKAFAISINTLDLDMPLAGAQEYRIPVPIQICNVACPIVQIASAVVFIITGLSILITKIKSKKQNEPKKIKKWVKVLFIISIIAFIISVLTNFIINTIDYY